ncbi:MAG: hypothetical protein IH594_16880 [Bacteroidales bacterium]|nr:hypothetical protein [Bacteroidales bacterium]
MQFILICYDGTDSGALARRMLVREDHLEKVRDLKKENNFIWGGAILDDMGKMIGSVVLYEYPDRESLDRMLETEPYILGKVWERIEIKPVRL